MAARNTDVTVGSTYTQLTDNDVTNISFQNKGFWVHVGMGRYRKITPAMLAQLEVTQ